MVEAHWAPGKQVEKGEKSEVREVEITPDDIKNKKLRWRRVGERFYETVRADWARDFKLENILSGPIEEVELCGDPDAQGDDKPIVIVGGKVWVKPAGGDRVSFPNPAQLALGVLEEEDIVRLERELLRRDLRRLGCRTEAVAFGTMSSRRHIAARTA